MKKSEPGNHKPGVIKLVKEVMMNSLELQIELLKQQIELEETNYRYAVELQKDYTVLRRMRDSARQLKEQLQALIETSEKDSFELFNKREDEDRVA